MSSCSPGADGGSPADFPQPPFGPSTCPDRRILAAFERGELSADASEPVVAHVESCTACQAVLGGLAGTPDALLDGLRHVRQALAAQGEPTLLTGPPVSAAALAPPGYKLLEKVGQGGMGVIHRARDLRLNREVAVKLLREGHPGGSAVCARFVAEAQITGQLQHPGIPAVHELGTLPSGRPFLAMKLVKGRTLQELLKERTDPARERGRFVAIFEQICQAVGYAHAHHVIHRDLKPGNVMVGAFGEVQVMDWGLAKVLSARASTVADDGELLETVPALTAIDTPLAGDSATRTGAVMGTPAYMPPEQAGGEVRKLDARSDVFGLGAILCQILTGQPPFSGKDANAVRLQAVRGELHEAFARLDGSGAEPDPVALCKKGLAFRREDRPADGRAVAQEVARIRQAAEERARRAELERAEALVREAEQRKRRRQLLTAAAVVAGVLLLGVVGTTIGLVQVRRAAEAERLAKRDAEDQKTKAEQANEQAQKRLKQVEKGNEVLLSIFEDLNVRQIRQGAEPVEAILAKRLVKAAEELEGEAVGDPLVVARLQGRLGQTLVSLGYPGEAVPLFEKARATFSESLGADDLLTLLSMMELGDAYSFTGQPDKAIPLLEETLRLRRATQGEDHPDTLESMGRLANAYGRGGHLDKAVPLLEETLRLSKARFGATHRVTATYMNNLATGYFNKGSLAKAIPLWEEALRIRTSELGSDHPDTLQTTVNLATGYAQTGRVDKALALLEMAVPRFEKKLGHGHPDTLKCYSCLAFAYGSCGQSAKTVALLEGALPLVKAKLGPDHHDVLVCAANLARAYRDTAQPVKAIPLLEELLRASGARNGAEHADTLTVMNSLGMAYAAAGQLDKALPLLERVLQVRRARSGADHADTLESMNNLALAYQSARRLQEALSLLEEVLRTCKARLGADDPRTLMAMSNLAVAYQEAGHQQAGQTDKALALLEEALRLSRAKPGAGPTQTLRCMNNLAGAYHKAGQLQKAVALYDEALRACRSQLGADHPLTLTTMSNLGVAHCDAGQTELALLLFGEYAARLRQRAKPNDPYVAEQLAAVGHKLLTCERYREAESYLRESAAISQVAAPEVWGNFHIMSMLGGALLGQKKYAEAEPLLLKGYEGLNQREAQMPAEAKTHLAEAGRRLVSLYDAWGKPAEAAKWRQELARRRGTESKPGP
jgi:serine/threonine protein kinase